MINKQNFKNFLILLFWMAVFVVGGYFAVIINREVNFIKNMLDIIK